MRAGVHEPREGIINMNSTAPVVSKLLTGTVCVSVVCNTKEFYCQIQTHTCINEAFIEAALTKHASDLSNVALCTVTPP